MSQEAFIKRMYNSNCMNGLEQGSAESDWIELDRIGLTFFDAIQSDQVFQTPQSDQIFLSRSADPWSRNRFIFPKSSLMKLFCVLYQWIYF